MTEQPWTVTFEETLRVYLTFLPPELPITADLNLVDHGLDSLATVGLLLELEDAFEVTIPDELLDDADTFATPAGLWSVIESLLNRAGVE